MAVMNLRSVPDDVHRQFKILCTMRGTNMTDAIVELMRGEILDAAQGDEYKAINQAIKAGLTIGRLGQRSNDK